MHTPHEEGTASIPARPDRRNFLGTSVLAGLASAGLTMGLAACNSSTSESKGAAAGGASGAAGSGGTAGNVDYSQYEVPPGQLDTYYSFSSGGHSGEARIKGLPSGRLFKRIPVFNMDALVGWGITNESKKIIGTNPDGSLKYTTGDTHHVHASTRTALTTASNLRQRQDPLPHRPRPLERWSATRSPSCRTCMGFHGIFPDKRDPVDANINYTTRVFCGSEFHIPLPNDGRDIDDPSK